MSRLTLRMTTGDYCGKNIQFGLSHCVSHNCLIINRKYFK